MTMKPITFDDPMVDQLARESGLHELFEYEMPAQWHWDALNVALPKFAALVAEATAAKVRRWSLQAGDGNGVYEVHDAEGRWVLYEDLLPK